MKNIKNKKAKSKGFTLIELLVVIAIIGVLSAIVLTSLNGARTKAKRASALSSLSSTLYELQSCLDDNGYITSSVNVPTADAVICKTSGGATISGHAGITWPNLSSSGFSYGAVTSGTTLSAGTLEFKATQSGFADITCSVVTNNCI